MNDNSQNQLSENDTWGLNFKEKMTNFIHELIEFTSNLQYDIENFDSDVITPSRAFPSHVSNQYELEIQFFLLILSVFDVGLTPTSITSCTQGAPLSDPSNWLSTIQNDATFISWLTITAWKVFPRPMYLQTHMQKVFGTIVVLCKVLPKQETYINNILSLRKHRQRK